jgi:hypothetical protein
MLELKMSNTDEDTLKKIERLEQILTETQQLFKRHKPLDLTEKILATSQLQEALGLLANLKPDPQMAPVKVTTEPVPKPLASLAEAISSRDAISVELRTSLNKLTDVKRVLSLAIPNKEADKAITSVSASPRPNQRIQNLFSNHYEFIELVFSTNSEAYVVSRSENGIYSVTAAKYWKVPELTPNSPVQK